MAAYAESNASFKSRAKQIQLTDAHIDALDDIDIKCFNHYAFAVCGQPGQLDAAKFQTLVDTVCPSGATVGVQAALRQLAYESLTVAVAAIRQRIEQPDDALKKLPAEEKDHRLQVLKSKITGFEITHEYEPSHSTIDAFAAMLQDGSIKILPLSKCISRDQELHSEKADKHVLHLEGNQIQVKNQQHDLASDLSNELKVHQAFIRRGLALEMANLASYLQHEKVVREFMTRLTQTPPPGFKKVTIEAVLRADKELWTRIADRCRSDLRMSDKGQYPVDVAMEELYLTPQVAFHLMPLPGASTPPVAAQPAADKKRKSEETVADVKQPRPGKGNAKGKGKRNKGAGRTSLPAGLHGFAGVNKKKMRICYNYNLPHGCHLETKVTDGALGCSRGVHECIKCHKGHSYQDCPDTQ